jgi:hypothetical protein
MKIQNMGFLIHPYIIMDTCYRNKIHSCQREYDYLNNAINENQVVANGICIKSRVAGINGNSMDFSWTWKENKKKEREEFIRAYKNLSFVG